MQAYLRICQTTSLSLSLDFSESNVTHKRWRLGEAACYTGLQWHCEKKLRIQGKELVWLGNYQSAWSSVALGARAKSPKEDSLLRDRGREKQREICVYIYRRRIITKKRERLKASFEENTHPKVLAKPVPWSLAANILLPHSRSEPPFLRTNHPATWQEGATKCYEF